MKDANRRAFLLRGVTSLGAVLITGAAGIGRAQASAARKGASAEKKGARPASREVPAPRRPPPRVCEIRITSLRESDPAASAGSSSPTGKIVATMLDESLYAAAIALTSRDLPPLDALSELFPNDPPVTVFVDPNAGSETARLLAMRLSSFLADMGSPSGKVAVVGSTDAEMQQAGYTIVRSGDGPFCHGAEPDPGYGKPVPVPGTGRTVRLLRALDDRSARAAVVARLGRGERGTSRFVIDAALRAVDARSRSECLNDPPFGARLLAGPLLGGRFSLVIGDLFEIVLDSPRVEPWRADEILAGGSVLSVESIGHTILTNTCLAKGLPAPTPHPILKAAQDLGLTEATTGGIDWRKGIL